MSLGSRYFGSDDNFHLLTVGTALAKSHEISPRYLRYRRKDRSIEHII